MTQEEMRRREELRAVHNARLVKSETAKGFWKVIAVIGLILVVWMSLELHGCLNVHP